ncbi:MAG TPA: hypothetical protein VJH03_00600 [Blastocatellia bacterium]|nr:hypothetical protein [Blastocatellia bacterium]
MAAEERIEYHWIENRLVQRRLTRPVGTKAWRFNRKTSTLVATVEPRNRSFFLLEGGAATPERLVDSVRSYKRVLVDDSTLDYTGSMPIAIREEFRAGLNNVISSALKQWDTFADEPDITGYFKGKLHGIVVERDGWRISMRAWTYDRNPKEKLLGLDLGIIFDVVYLGKRLIKAIWYQAKIAEEEPISLNTVPDLSEQVVRMRHHTKESYILIYTKEGVFTASDVSGYKISAVE